MIKEWTGLCECVCFMLLLQDGNKLHLIQELKVDFVTWSSNICHGTSNHKNSNYVGKCPWMIEAIESGIQNM